MKPPYARRRESDPALTISFPEAYHKACADLGFEPFAKNQLHGDLLILSKSVEVIYHGNSIPRDVMSGTLDHFNYANGTEYDTNDGVIGLYGIEHPPGFDSRRAVMTSLCQIAFWGTRETRDIIG